MSVSRLVRVFDLLLMRKRDVWIVYDDSVTCHHFCLFSEHVVRGHCSSAISLLLRTSSHKDRRWIRHQSVFLSLHFTDAQNEVWDIILAATTYKNDERWQEIFAFPHQKINSTECAQTLENIDSKNTFLHVQSKRPHADLSNSLINRKVELTWKIIFIRG